MIKLAPLLTVLTVSAALAAASPLGSAPAEASTEDDRRSLVVGRVSGDPGSDEAQAGDIVADLVQGAADQLGAHVLTSNTLDEAFFDQIDLFVFANAQGAFEYTLGPTARAELVDFVNGGGTAYLGLDLLQDAAAIVADFGWTLADRNTQVGTTGAIVVTDHPIATGPFQPAGTFILSFHGRFVAPFPPDGLILGDSSYGAVLVYRRFGKGKVYVFADEVALQSGVANHDALFLNAAVDAGLTLKDGFEQP